LIEQYNARVQWPQKPTEIQVTKKCGCFLGTLKRLVRRFAVLDYLFVYCLYLLEFFFSPRVLLLFLALLCIGALCIFVEGISDLLFLRRLTRGVRRDVFVDSINNKKNCKEDKHKS